jgi:hypothetical protein
VIQLFLVFVKSGYLNKISIASAKILLNSFFNHSLFKIFFSSDWKSFIDWYIDYAKKVYQNGKSDPANNVVWYSNQIDATLDQIYSSDNLKRVKYFIKNSLERAVATFYRV